MSDTPRTDRATWREGVAKASECATAEFARELERENARLREERVRYQSAASGLWYETWEAAGTVRAVEIHGERFVRIED